MSWRSCAIYWRRIILQSPNGKGTLWRKQKYDYHASAWKPNNYDTNMNLYLFETLPQSSSHIYGAVFLVLFVTIQYYGSPASLETKLFVWSSTETSCCVVLVTILEDFSEQTTTGTKTSGIFGYSSISAS